MLKDKISQFHEFSYFSGNTIVLLLVLNNFIGLAHTYPGTRLICEGNLSIVKKNEAFQSLFWVVTGCASVIMSKKFIDFFLILNILSQIIAFIFMVKKINSPFDLVSGITQLRFFLLGPSSFIKKNLTYSLLLKLNGFTFKQSDSLMVSFFLGEKDLAILDISLKFLSFFKVMLGKMNELVFVKFTRSTDVKKEVPTALFGRILNVLFIISLCYSVFIFVFSDYLMELWLGDSFQPSYPWLLRLSSLVVLTLPLSQTVPSYLIAIEKKIDETVKSIAFISVLNVFVTFFLIKFAKIEGVIISTLFQQLLLGKVLFNRCRFEIKQRKLIQKNFFISFFILLSYLILANIGLLSVSNLWITSVLLVYLLFMMFYNSLIDEIFFLVRN
jgi:O-antigen/teichoic acid export membrane protein